MTLEASNSGKRRDAYSVWPRHEEEQIKWAPKSIFTILSSSSGLNRGYEVCIAKQSWSKHGPAHH